MTAWSKLLADPSRWEPWKAMVVAFAVGAGASLAIVAVTVAVALLLRHSP